MTLSLGIHEEQKKGSDSTSLIRRSKLKATSSACRIQSVYQKKGLENTQPRMNPAHSNGSLQKSISSDLKELPPALANCLSKFAESIDQMNHKFDSRLKSLEASVERLSQGSYGLSSSPIQREPSIRAMSAPIHIEAMSTSPLYGHEEIHRQMSRRNSVHVSPGQENASITNRIPDPPATPESIHIQFQCDTFGYQNFHSS